SPSQDNLPSSVTAFFRHGYPGSKSCQDYNSVRKTPPIITIQQQQRPHRRTFITFRDVFLTNYQSTYSAILRKVTIIYGIVNFLSEKIFQDTVIRPILSSFYPQKTTQGIPRKGVSPELSIFQKHKP
ncbi:hypothetical protein, partial [Alistipes ihumii]|uniref:hypothetical protein n=1 Tax=Alistipes ihumii TaxID=1470347 RepID=UPI003AB230FF